MDCVRVRNILIGAALAATVLLPGVAQADAHSEIVNAATHAGYAAGAPDLAGAQTHLHHTLNCLVGPKGDGFDAKQMNPCAQAGNGALPDTSDAAKKAALETAAEETRTGIAAKDLATAKKAASDVQAMLVKAE